MKNMGTTLRQVLAVRFTADHHLTGPNVAKILGVPLERIHAALKPLEDRRLITVTERDVRGGVAETWHMESPSKDFDDLVRNAQGCGIDLDVDI